MQQTTVKFVSKLFP